MTRFTFRTAGESHGSALCVIIEGLPAGMCLDLDAIDADLARRQEGYGRGGRMKIERDRVECLSGLKGGMTLGSPLTLLVQNKDAVIEQLPPVEAPRPGHADLAGCMKYGHRDGRAVLERASARETAARVAAGAVARQLLAGFGVEVFAHVLEVGGQPSPSPDPEVLWARSSGQRHALRAASAFHGLDPALEEVWTHVVDQAKKEGDSLGGIFEVRILGLPPGLGSYQSGLDRLTSRLGAALFSIPAIKGVEFGLGFAVGRLPGSQVHDPITPAPPESPRRFARPSNRCGGLEGGLTTGEPLVVRAAMKPIPSLRQGMASVDLESGEAKQATYQRSDVTSVPAASVVGEAVAALALVEVFLDKYGGDSLDQVQAAFEFHAEQLRAL